MDSTLFNQWIGSAASSVEFDKDVPRFSYNDMLAFGEFIKNKYNPDVSTLSERIKLERVKIIRQLGLLRV